MTDSNSSLEQERENAQASPQQRTESSGSASDPAGDSGPRSFRIRIERYNLEQSRSGNRHSNVSAGETPTRSIELSRLLGGAGTPRGRTVLVGDGGTIPGGATLPPEGRELLNIIASRDHPANTDSGRSRSGGRATRATRVPIQSIPISNSQDRMTPPFRNRDSNRNRNDNSNHPTRASAIATDNTSGGADANGDSNARSDSAVAPAHSLHSGDTRRRIFFRRNNETPMDSATFPQSSMQIAVPELRLIPLPFSSDPSLDQYSPEEKAILSTFDCPICFDTVRDPSTCGKCDAAFCKKCLITHLNHQMSRGSQTRIRTSEPNCPICRRKLLASEVKTHEKMKSDLRDCGLKRICAHVGCQKRFDLLQIVQHEEDCSMRLYECRYKHFGCNWKGTQEMASRHENGTSSEGSSGCAYHRVRGLVNSYRKLDAQNRACLHESRMRYRIEHQRMLESMRQLQSSSEQLSVRLNETVDDRDHLLNRIADLHGNLTRQTDEAMEKVLSSPLNWIELVFRATTEIVEFCKSERKTWKRFYATEEDRALVHTVMSLFPFALWCTKIYFGFIRSLGAVKQESLLSMSLFLEMNFTMLTEMVLSICGYGVFVAFMIDGKSSRTWTQCHNLGCIIWIQPRDAAYFTSAFLHYLFLTASGSKNFRVLEYFLEFLYTSVFPDVFQCILVMASLPPNARLPEAWIIQRGKGMSVLSFGVKYGIILHLFGFKGLVFGRCNFLLVSHALNLFNKYLPKFARNSAPKQARNFLLNPDSDCLLDVIYPLIFFLMAILLTLPKRDSFWLTLFVSFMDGWKAVFTLTQMNFWIKVKHMCVGYFANMIAKGCFEDRGGSSFWNRLNVRLLSIHSLLFWCIMIAFHLNVDSNTITTNSFEHFVNFEKETSRYSLSVDSKL